MPKHDDSDSESQETNSDSASDEQGTEGFKNVERKPVSDYEMKRLKRIEENRARMQEMGLHKMASAVLGSIQKAKKVSDEKGKRKVTDDEDEDYRPEGDEEFSSASGDDDNDDDDEFSESSLKKKHKAKTKTLTPKKRTPSQMNESSAGFLDDDDDALMQAIALSLQDSAGFLDVAKVKRSPSSIACAVKGSLEERNGDAQIPEDTGKRKRKKPVTSRVQMTEDELLVHFFQFDEAGKGGISLRDIRRVAAAHDFPWTDKEMADMIHCFDSDGDGKLALEEFRKIVTRCNMLKE